MATSQPGFSTSQKLYDGNMSLQHAFEKSSVEQAYKSCVHVDQEALLGRSTNSLTKLSSTVSLPLSHPLFSADTVHVLPPFNSRTGGIPLRTFSFNDTVTVVTLASGDNLYAAQSEAIWQFEIFVQGIHSATISQTCKADILTLGGTEVAPRRIVGEYTGEEHYLGWKIEHFNQFCEEYMHSSITEVGDCVLHDTAANWHDLVMPKWLSAADLADLCKSPISALDRSLQESISATKKESAQPKKTFEYRSGLANQARKGKVSRSAALQSRSVGDRGRASKKGVLKLSSNRKPGPAIRPNNIYSKNAWYHGRKGADHCKDRDRYNQKRSILPPRSIQLRKIDSPQTPIISLRDANGLGAAISKIVKPYQCITARFQDRKPSNEKAPLTQSVRDFIAQKIEEQLLIPAQQEAILHIIRTVSPKEYNQRRNGRLIDYRNMPDRLYQQLARLLSVSSVSATNRENASTYMDSDASSAQCQALTPEMVRFTRENILRLAPKRLDELAKITERTVSSVDALPDWRTNVLQPEDLPVEKQIMTRRYVRMHLPKEEGATGIEGGEGDGGMERWEELRREMALEGKAG